MRKILVMFIMSIIAFVMVGCDGKNQTYDESNYSKLLNQLIEDSFESNNGRDLEAIGYMSFAKFLDFYDERNKFLLSVKKENDNVICGYLDNSFNEVFISDLDFSSSFMHIIKQLSEGTYYLELTNYSFSQIPLSLTITSRNTTYLDYGENDVLLNTYNNIIDYYYLNDQSSGFYEFKMRAQKLMEQ